MIFLQGSEAGYLPAKVPRCTPKTPTGSLQNPAVPAEQSYVYVYTRMSQEVSKWLVSGL